MNRLQKIKNDREYIKLLDYGVSLPINNLDISIYFDAINNSIFYIKIISEEEINTKHLILKIFDDYFELFRIDVDYTYYFESSLKKSGRILLDNR